MSASVDTPKTAYTVLAVPAGTDTSFGIEITPDDERLARLDRRVLNDIAGDEPGARFVLVPTLTSDAWIAVADRHDLTVLDHVDVAF